MKFPKRRKKDVVVDAVSTEPVFSDVKIIGKVAGPVDDSADLLSELSAAFEDESGEISSGDDPTDDSSVDPSPGAGVDDDATTPAERTTIAIGAEDDLPDAVYLDDELGLGAGGSDTVFIDDDGTGDAVLAQDATGPGIEPRLRQRRIGVRREEGRRRLRLVATVALVIALVVAVLATLGSGLFSVKNIELTGQEFADAEEVMAVIDDINGTPTLLVDTDDAERRLESIAWIESARVRTDFPSTVSIEIRERIAVATRQGPDGSYRILDSNGRVLDVIPGQPVAFVLITGQLPGNLGEGAFADAGTAAAASMSVKFGPAVRSRLISMSATPDGSDIRLVLSNEPGENIEVRLGAAIGDNDQLERLVRLDRVLSDVTGGGTTVIDVSTPETTCLPSCTS